MPGVPSPGSNAAPANAGAAGRFSGMQFRRSQALMAFRIPAYLARRAVA
jgi:hypothetical protein